MANRRSKSTFKKKQKPTEKYPQKYKASAGQGGWFRQSPEHSLASQGIATKQPTDKVKDFFRGAGRVVGTAGRGVVKAGKYVGGKVADVVKKKEEHQVKVNPDGSINFPVMVSPAQELIDKVAKGSENLYDLKEAEVKQIHDALLSKETLTSEEESVLVDARTYLDEKKASDDAEKQMRGEKVKEAVHKIGEKIKHAELAGAEAVIKAVKKSKKEEPELFEKAEHEVSEMHTDEDDHLFNLPTTEPDELIDEDVTDDEASRLLDDVEQIRGINYAGIFQTESTVQKSSGKIRHLIGKLKEALHIEDADLTRQAMEKLEVERLKLQDTINIINDTRQRLLNPRIEHYLKLQTRLDAIDTVDESYGGLKANMEFVDDEYADLKHKYSYFRKLETGKWDAKIKAVAQKQSLNKVSEPSVFGSVFPTWHEIWNPDQIGKSGKGGRR